MTSTAVAAILHYHVHFMTDTHLACGVGPLACGWRLFIAAQISCCTFHSPRAAPSELCQTLSSPLINSCFALALHVPACITALPNPHQALCTTTKACTT
jgi:hypothetical protein